MFYTEIRNVQKISVLTGLFLFVLPLDYKHSREQDLPPNKSFEEELK